MPSAKPMGRAHKGEWSRKSKAQIRKDEIEARERAKLDKYNKPKTSGKTALIRTYTKEELEILVKESDNFSEVVVKAGYSSPCSANLKATKERIKEFGISTAHFYTRAKREQIRHVKDEKIFCKHSKAAHTTLRQRFKDREFKPYVCEICGQEPEWQGKPLTLIMDHKDGIRNNNELSNLRWVCPNCNQQLQTTGFKGYIYDEFGNKRKKKLTKKVVKKPPKKRKKRAKKKQSTCRADIRKKYGVTRNKLKDLIRDRGFSYTGRLYGVSCNTVKDWCEKFNLPTKASEIKAYSYADWKNV